MTVMSETWLRLDPGLSWCLPVNEGGLWQGLGKPITFLWASNPLIRGSQSLLYMGLTWSAFTILMPGSIPRPTESDPFGVEPRVVSF